MKNSQYCVVVVVAILAILAWSFWNRPAPTIYKPPTRMSAQGKEIFLKTIEHPDGHWYPIVNETDAKLLQLLPPQLEPGRDIAHVNTDGTVIITNHVEAAKRSGWESMHSHGYPHYRVKK